MAIRSRIRIGAVALGGLWSAAFFCATALWAAEGVPGGPAPAAAPLASPEAASLSQIEQHLKASIPPGVEETRESTERYPVESAVSLMVSNEFGEVRIASWDEHVVEVHARIRVRAESAEVAKSLADATRVSVARADGRLELSTVLPGPPKPEGYISAQVDYVLIVPKDASISIKNFFGDTSVEGIHGPVIVDAHYGAITLTGLAAPARVTSRGEFPVKAVRLRQGGVFDLHGGPAEFTDTGGELRVYSFRGDVLFRTPAPDARIDASVDSASLRVLLSREIEPDLTAAVIYGELTSALPVEESSQGDKRMARHRAAGAAQFWVLHAAFGGIQIEYAGAPEPAAATAAPVAEGEQKPFTEPESISEEAAQATRLEVRAAPGDVRIQGSDQERFEVSAQRMAWVESASQAPAALEALKINVVREGGAVRIVSTDESVAAPGGPNNSRIHLDIKCPRQLGIEVQATDGKTTLSDLNGPVIVRQTAGSVLAERIKSGLSVTNEGGSVTASDCGGLEAITRRGNAVIKRIFGPVRVDATEGHILIESPQGPVTAHSVGGDIRILALEGVLGAFDARAEAGHISLLLAPDSDVALFVKSIRGTVHSAVPLQGMLSKDQQEFSGRMKDGLFQVRLETTDGGIAID